MGGVSSEPDVHGGGLPRRIRGLFKVSRLSTGSLVAQTPRPFYRQAQGWRLAEWQRVGSRGLTSSSARACRSFYTAPDFVLTRRRDLCTHKEAPSVSSWWST